MRNLLLLLSLVLIAAPALKLIPLDEALYAKTVAAQKGKVVLVNFWATWCEPCRKEMPELVRIAKGMKGQGLELIAISADEPEDEKIAIDFLVKAGVGSPTYARRAKNDDKFINAIDPKWSGALPALILYDRSGKKVKSWIGESDLKVVQAEIKKLL